MSNKTNLTNSDTSNISSNEDGTVSKYSDYQRSYGSSAYSSSQLSRDTKNQESGIGTSVSSSVTHGASHHHHHHHGHAAQNSNMSTSSSSTNKNRFALIDELNALINPGASAGGDNQKSKSASSSSYTLLNTSVGAGVGPGQVEAKQQPISSQQIDVDSVMFKAIQYIKKLQESSKHTHAKPHPATCLHLST